MPHGNSLGEFLATASEWFDLAVWSSASEGYIGAMVEALFPSPKALRFVWSCKRCTRRLDGEWRREYWVKDLKKVKRAGYPLERVLAIDDSPEKLERQYGNLVRVRPFLGDPADRELPALLRFLERLRGTENVRTVEKHDWRGRFPGG